MIKYKGAGILFVSEEADGLKFFLGKRLYWPRVWSIPGGGRDKGEDSLNNALRECEEEINIVLDKDPVYFKKFNIKVPLVYDWTTFVAKVDRNKFDNNYKILMEFDAMDWFKELPDNSHQLLKPIVKEVKSKWAEEFSQLKECPIYPKVKKKYFHDKNITLRGRRFHS